jgi:unsaturated rhamnogalacturonyl hydrolase
MLQTHPRLFLALLGLFCAALLAGMPRLPAAAAFASKAAAPPRPAPAGGALFLPLVGRNIVGPEVRRLTASARQETQPALAPDGSLVAYIGIGDGGETDLYVTDLASGATRNLTNSPQVAEETPLFAPDGASLAFVGKASGDGAIYAISPSGADLRTLVDRPGSDEVQPAFAPDGATLFFASNRANDDWDIYSAPLAGGGWTNLTNSPSIDRFPVVGFGGKWLVYRAQTAGNSDLYRMNLDGSNRRRLTSAASYEGYPAATPAHTGLAYFVLDGAQGEVWTMNDAGGGSARWLGGPGWQVEAPRFTPDGGHLLFAMRLPGDSLDLFMAPIAPPLQQVGEAVFGALAIDCSWEGGILAYGWARVWEITGDAVYRGWLDRWVNGCYESGFQVQHVNDLPYAYAALVLHADDPQPRYLEIAAQAADFVMHQAPRTADGALIHLADALWPDTLMMATPFLIRYGQTTGENFYTQEAIKQMNLHATALQHPSTRLYRHASPVSAGGVSSPTFWGRGNGWVLVSAAEVLRNTVTDEPGRAILLQNYQQHAAAMIALLDSGDRWRTVVNQPAFYYESSGSALAAAGLIEGVARGWLDAGQFAAAAQRARDGVWQQVLAGGKLDGVSDPTGPMTPEALYNQVPVGGLRHYGQGAALILGAAEWPSPTATIPAGQE